MSVKIKWYTVVERVDVETGEIITKWEAERNYRVKNREIKTENKGTHGIKTILQMCEKNKQIRLWEIIE